MKVNLTGKIIYNPCYCILCGKKVRASLDNSNEGANFTTWRYRKENHNDYYPFALEVYRFSNIITCCTNCYREYYLSIFIEIYKKIYGNELCSNNVFRVA